MHTIYSPLHHQHAPTHEFLEGRLLPCYELPSRAELILHAINDAGIGPVIPPRTFGLDPILAVHRPAYVHYLAHAYERWVAAGGAPEGVIPSTLPIRGMSGFSPHPFAEAGYYSFDTCAPIVAGTYTAASASADVALTGAALLCAGETVVYALCRPPGHHAGPDYCGGYCFFNNAAIAANYLARSGGNAATSNDPQSATVALLDIDYHHGNGTQAIFYERNDVFVVSIHADPQRDYPFFTGFANERGSGRGLDYNLNLPVAAGANDTAYLAILDQALTQIRAHQPRWLVISAGFDTFDGDPLGDLRLSTAAYCAIGARIAALETPTLIVQEGGYAVAALGTNVVSLLQAFST